MTNMGPSVAASAVRAGVKLVIAGCLVIMNLVAWGYITDEHFVRFSGIFDTWGLTYTYNKAVSAQSLDAYDTHFVALLWLPLLLMAYCAMLLLVVPHGAVPRAYKYVRRQFTRMLAWEAPPRRFWTWWCGGMNGRDMVVLSFSIAFNLWYFMDYYIQYRDWLDAVVEAGVTLPEPYSRLMLERVALIAGIMMWPCIWLLFLPIPQSNFLQWLSGMTYTEMIRYHRWLGHITMVVLSLHGWLYYLYWALKGAFWVNFTDWSEQSSINFLAGSLAYIFGLILWVTSINWIRRRFFEVFYRSHLICFVLFTLFSCLLLYAVDLVLRAGQLSNTTVVTGATVDNEAGVATVQLKASRDTCKCPIGELFMLVPSISRWQWHPITVAGTQADSEGKGSIITVSIKRYGKWTKELLEKLQRPEPLEMRVSAPQGPNHDYWKGCNALVLLGGGIGATPLLYMLRNMIALRKTNPKAELPERVHFVWASRQPREFCLLDAELLEVATSSGGWLTIELYSTRELPITDALPSNKMDVSKSSPRGSDSDGDVKRMDSIVGKRDSGEIADAMAGGAGKLDSPYFHKVARVVQPQAVGFLHLSAVYLITWFAAFMGTVLGGVYVGESALYTDVPGVNKNKDYLYSGTIWFFTQFIVTIGLPYLLCVLPMHSWRYWRATRQPGSEEVLELVPPGEPVGHGKPSQLVGGMITACGESGVEVRVGRPSLRDAVQAVGAQYGSNDTVGVFVGGPEPMTRQVQLDTADLNGWIRREGPYYQFRALAFFL